MPQPSPKFLWFGAVSAAILLGCSLEAVAAESTGFQCGARAVQRVAGSTGALCSQSLKAAQDRAALSAAGRGIVRVTCVLDANGQLPADLFAVQHDPRSEKTAAKPQGTRPPSTAPTRGVLVY